MGIRKNIWQAIWRPSVRKLVLGLLVLALGTAYAYKSNATFVDYSSYLKWWLGIMVAVHVVDKKVKDQATSTDESDSSPPKK